MIGRVGVIGGGVMGEALIRGLLRRQLVHPKNIAVSGPRKERVEELAHRYKIRATTSNAMAVHGASIVLLTFKPQVAAKVLPEIRGQIKSEALVFSIVAGVPMAAIKEGLGARSVIRAMTNTPAQINQGITVWTHTPEVTEAQIKWSRLILSTMGEEVCVDDERYLDMATALIGNGPAYVFLFMEAMVEAGVHLGFSRRVAQDLVTQTVIGSSIFAKESSLHLAALRNQVTSPGGTTAEALYHLEKGGFRTVLARAIWAGYTRSRQLGRGLDRVEDRSLPGD